MKKLLACLASALVISAAPAAAQVVNISASSDAGQVVSLGAGTYSIEFIGTTNGGLYDAWNPWSTVTGCNPGGMNCSFGWAISLAVDLGHGSGNFDMLDGVYYGHLPDPGNNHLFSTAAAALLDAQTGGALDRATLLDVNDDSLYFPTAYPLSLTLGAAQDVKFFIFDNPYTDNSGGVSIRITGSGTPSVPEPGTWAMMIAGFGVAGGVLRRRQSARTATA